MLLNIFIVVSLILFGYIMIRLYRVLKPPKNFPSKYLKTHTKWDPSKKRLVLVGDSITHGTIGYNYVKILKKKLSKDRFEFINAGLNGDLTINVLERLDDIIKCQPDIITILIGTNDALGSFSVKARNRYIKKKGAKSDDDFWTLERFKKDYSKIITKLKNETKAKIGLISIPIIGEDLTGPVLNHSRLHAEIIKEISKQLETHYMGLNERMIEYIKENPSNPKYKYEAGLKLVVRGIISHFFGRTWKSIAERNGLSFLTDLIHLNPKGARLVSDLIENFIERI